MIYISSRTIEEGKENRLEREKIYTLCTPPPPPAYSGGRIRHTSFTCCCGRFLLLFLHLFFVLNIERRLFFLDTTTVKSVFSKRSSSTREDFSLSCACIACACHISSVSSLFLCFSALCVRLKMMMQCGFFPALVIHWRKSKGDQRLVLVSAYVSFYPPSFPYMRPPTHNDAFSSNFACFLFDCASLFNLARELPNFVTTPNVSKPFWIGRSQRYWRNV